jgi:hypothetical protein
VADRFDDIADSVEIRIPENWRANLNSIQVGSIHSHLQNIKDFYYNTSEPYALFCDDDTSFESIENWNFDWSEFTSKLPSYWNVVQLIRLNTVTNLNLFEFNIQMRYGRWWGAVWLMSRQYAGHILAILTNADDSYNLIVNGGYLPILENVFFLNSPLVLNFPLFWENWQLETTDNAVGAIHDYRKMRHFSNYIVEYLWKTQGKTLDLNSLMEPI